MINFPLLTSEDIEVKIKQVTKTGALMLLYKTSRTDAKILDAAVGPMNWTNRYFEVKGNLFCEIGIREDASQDFVYKSDCGIESEQGDGNEKKAEASDAFKRCCSRLGIGRELYSSPLIWADVSTVERNGKYYLADPYAKYVVTHIAYNEDTRVITELEICNAKTNVKVFSWKLPTTGAVAKKMVNTVATNDENQSSEPVAASGAKVESVSTTNSSSEKTPLKTLISDIGKMVKNMNTQKKSIAEYNEIVKAVTGDTTFKCNAATQDQYDTVLAIHQKLIEGGYGA